MEPFRTGHKIGMSIGAGYPAAGSGAISRSVDAGLLLPAGDRSQTGL